MQAHSSSQTAIIVSCGDSGKYLTAVDIGNGIKTYDRDKVGELIYFECLQRAKSHLAEKGFQEAELQIDSVYDEMIGEAACDSSSYTIPIP
ncbi:DUF6482 family protein [Enterovibrio coralii]|uniref:Uncharacterized protein n=1 Tax=Enterovibrio coralii TaxID=294935 RepID=A0A135I980_9GAMM|nr:DUF6482 family protein [Enterovibrio coralii]KXF82013.1 hypothetical protein ATN88_18900 [Enterovibrio coralii]